MPELQEGLWCMGEPGTYGGLPYVTDQKLWKEYDYVIAGVPYDMQTSYRAGARLAPAGIRENSHMEPFHAEHHIDMSAYAKGADFGNIKITSGDEAGNFKKITDTTADLLESQVIPILLGGDHSITYHELKAYRQIYGPMALIYFSAHHGMNGNREYPNHNSVIRLALEEGLIDAEHSIALGMRSMLGCIEKYGLTEKYGLAECELAEKNGLAEYELAEKYGLECISAAEVHNMGISKTAEKIHRRAGKQKIMVSFSMDFLDPMFAPGTGRPVSEGFSSFETLELLRGALTGLDIKGFDLTEVSPNYDSCRMTQNLASDIVNEFIALIACKKAGVTEYALREG